MKKCLNATVVVYYFDGEDYRIGRHYHYDTTDTSLELIKQTLELYETCIKGTTPIRIDVERHDHMNTLRQIRNKEMLDSGVLGDPNSLETLIKYWYMQKAEGLSLADARIAEYEAIAKRGKRDAVD